jgi:ubiquinone/menaquinone biosynthesis C-methylase UbiE
MEVQWNSLIWPMIKGFDFTTVVDLAAGHGRNSVMLLKEAKRLYIVDINRECIEYCQKRFQGMPNITYVQNDGYSLKAIPDGTISLIYSFDSMVHFDIDVIGNYAKEFYRILKPGGHGFVHHSNYTKSPGSHFLANPHCRNFMSKELFAYYLIRSGLQVESQTVIDWGGVPELDCLTIFKR